MQDARLLGPVPTDVVDHLSVFALCFRPGWSCVEPVAVGTRHIRDIPDGVGACAVLQCATSHRISELLQRTTVTVECTRVVVGSGIVGRSLELVGLFVPHRRVQFHIGGLGSPLCFDVGIVESIEQSCAIHSDCRLQSHVILRWLRVGVEGGLWNRHNGIDE